MHGKRGAWDVAMQYFHTIALQRAVPDDVSYSAARHLWHGPCWRWGRVNGPWGRELAALPEQHLFSPLEAGWCRGTTRDLTCN